MSGTTISGTFLTPVTLSNAATQNPATIAAGTTISLKKSGTALGGASGTYWTVVNDGVVSGTIGISLASGGNIFDGAGSSVTGTSYGIILGNGGSITNAAGAVVRGGAEAVDISGNAGTVINSGLINATDATSGVAVHLKAGGLVTNAAAASIAGGKGGADIEGGAGTVVNSGSISASNLTSGAGVYLGAGGSVTNQASASIYGGRYGVEIATASGLLVNSGLIHGGAFGALLLDGGTVTNSASGEINANTLGVAIEGGIGTVINSGTISEAGTSAFSAVYLTAGGSVTNNASASILGGRYGIDILGGAGTVSNFGAVRSVYSGSGAGIYLRDGGAVANGASASIAGAIGVHVYGDVGTVSNFGSIGKGVVGVRLDGGGSVTNAASASISGEVWGVAVNHSASTSTPAVINSGVIDGAGATNSIGVYLETGGAVSNAEGASITGNRIGVKIVGAAGTVINSGTIGSSDYETHQLLPSGGYAYPTPSGVYLQTGGSVTNAASGVIKGQTGILYRGAYSANSSMTVVNAGTILAVATKIPFEGTPPGYGIDAAYGLTVLTNTAGASIRGGNVGVGADHATIMNAGTIAGAGTGVLIADGYVYNAAGGSIQGNYGTGVFIYH